MFPVPFSKKDTIGGHNPGSTSLIEVEPIAHFQPYDSRRSTMRRTFRQRIFLPALLVLGCILGWAAVSAECYNYPNSRVEYHEGQAVCAGSGNGCTECTNGGGGSCVTTGSHCGPLHDY